MQRITFFERLIIESGLRSNKSARAIARSLGRDHRVIQREINRNTVSGRPYKAKLAQLLTNQREAQRHRRKLEQPKFAKLRQHVIENIQADHSPEQIAGALKEQPPPNLCGQNICHETIYQYIYSGEGRYEYLWPHLRRARKKRQKRWIRKVKHPLILDRISIHERPDEINLKMTAGHWESDTLEGKRSTKANLSVQYERKFQLLRLHKVADKTAAETENAIRKSIDSLPLPLWKSITFDNGREAANHVALRNDYGLKTFFCDAYASWQKGGVENANGLIRQYIPKGSDISKMTDKQIYAIQNTINSRPRKSLNYLSPNQALAIHLGH